MRKKEDKFLIKTPDEIKIMTEGGKKLKFVKESLRNTLAEGVSAKEIDDLAYDLILKEKAKPSFKMVPGYYWTTCINTNDGIVHGIPKKEIVFKKNDVVSVDVGLFYKGFHTDTSFSVGLSTDRETDLFLETGRIALKKAINEARAGNRIYDISTQIERAIKTAGYSPVKALVGHGVGRDLHEGPQIPCFTDGSYEVSPKIPEGAVLAIEVMYIMGLPDLKLDQDGWTIKAADGTISALFEETVAVTEVGPKVLTS